MLEAYEARCPMCGCLDVDLRYSFNPLKDGVKCYDCGHIYPLEKSNGERRPELDVEAPRDM